MADGYVQVTTTTDSQEEADRLSRGVVEQRLAACAQVSGPIQSTYWWQGAIETASEWLCVMKTVTDRLDALVTYLRAEHNYDTPDITATPITGGSADYLAWVAAETAERRQSASA